MQIEKASRLAVDVERFRRISNPSVKLDELGKRRIERSESARIFIPEPVDIARRESCLCDPEKALRTYFAPIFYNPFAKHHVAMIDAIWERCWSGGDKAVAAPRGDGKSQIAICLAIIAHIATEVRFPVLIGNTLSKGRKLFKQYKAKFENASKYPEFHADFPELCVPVVSLRGAPQRAASQHVDGEPTRITWSQELVVLPKIKCDWETNNVGGKRLAFFGLDSAIRGEGFEEDRPDFAIIDDPETREVAFSPTDRHFEIEEMIDGDVAGLAGPNKRISRVVLTTIQNRRCYSFRVTDRKTKPSFEGERHSQLLTWPKNKELWDEYLAIRQKDQSDGYKDGPNATQYYRDNFESMNEGATLGNPHRFVSEKNSDGEPVELDGVQAFFNRVSDWGLARALAELQNEPEEEEAAEKSTITAGTIQSRMSGLNRNEIPKIETKGTTVFGIDMGIHNCFWVKLFIHGNCICHVVDYGVIENHGMQHDTPMETVERSLLNRLHEFRVDLITSGQLPDLVFIDSGAFTQAVYQFCSEAGPPFLSVKGASESFRFNGSDDESNRHFEEVKASRQPNGIWLYHVNGVYWKNQVQQRFRTSTFDDAYQLVDGSLSIFSVDNKREHLSFSQHMVSEGYVEKGMKRKWELLKKNNHWLDAMAYALAGTSCLGYQLLKTEKPLSEINQSQQPKPVYRQRQNHNFRQRQGGWIKGARR